MRINPVDRITLYGLRSNRENTVDDIKKVIKKVYPLPDKTLEVYTAINQCGEKVHKLYYLRDSIGNWLKSKLIYFTNNRRDKIVRSERS